jgi:hypothetical protein
MSSLSASWLLGSQCSSSVGVDGRMIDALEVIVMDCSAYKANT